MKETKHCMTCGKELSAHYPCGQGRRRWMFCSPVCSGHYHSSKVPIAEAIKLYETGMTQTEIGVRFGVSQVAIYDLFKRHQYKCRKTTYRQAGDKNPRWRGDEAGYTGLHIRVKTAKGKAPQHACVGCGNKAQDWANLTGHYTDINDYSPMCRLCHRKYDAAHPEKKGKKSVPNK